MKNFNAINNVEAASYMYVIFPSNSSNESMLKQTQMVMNALKILNSEGCSLVYYNNKSVLPKGLYIFSYSVN